MRPGWPGGSDKLRDAESVGEPESKVYRLRSSIKSPIEHSWRIARDMFMLLHDALLWHCRMRMLRSYDLHRLSCWKVSACLGPLALPFACTQNSGIDRCACLANPSIRHPFHGAWLSRL